MAKTTVDKWDVAEALGLVYKGELDIEGVDGTYWLYKYDFHGRDLFVPHGCGDDEAIDEKEAHEEAAGRLLKAIGEKLAEMIG